MGWVKLIPLIQLKGTVVKTGFANVIM